MSWDGLVEDCERNANQKEAGPPEERPRKRYKHLMPLCVLGNGGARRDGL
jgi:hypothetical protein